jgi:hypothetical protein
MSHTDVLPVGDIPVPATVPTVNGILRNIILKTPINHMVMLIIQEEPYYADGALNIFTHLKKC